MRNIIVPKYICRDAVRRKKEKLDQLIGGRLFYSRLEAFNSVVSIVLKSWLATLSKLSTREQIVTLL